MFRKKPIAYFVFILYVFLHQPILGIEFVGNYSHHNIQDNTVLFYCSSTVVSIQLCTEDIIKVKLFPSGNVQDDTSFVIVYETWPPVGFTVHEMDDRINIETESIIIACQKRPFRIRFYDKAGQPILLERDEGGLGWENEVRYAYFQQDADDHFYGFGEKSIALDRKGYRFDVHNQQRYGYSGELSTMNINIPFFCTTKGYGLYFDNTYIAHFDMGYLNPDYFYYRTSGGTMIYYFIYGPSLKQILTKYTWLTGRQPLPPRWALGYLQSKYGYENEEEARWIVNTMRQKGIPCDAIILDLYWFGRPGLMGNLSWDRSRWPNPEQMMSDFREVGIKTILIEEPYITTQSDNYWNAYYQGYFGTDASGQPMVFNTWVGQASLLDLTNPVVQAWWWEKHKSLIDQGVAGWWTDLGEPETHPSAMQHYLGPMAKVHNIFNLLWSKTIYEGYQSYRPNERLFNLTRSGFAGMQRYSTFPWSGDVSKSFGGLQAQLPIMLGMGMSGVAYQHSDIGGFTGYTTPELYARWMELGTFCPITRPHGAWQDTEPWAFDPNTEAICSKYIKLRYQLLPYIYTYAYQNHTYGWPLARPLVFEYSQDPQVYNLSSEYLWGDAFLVAPVIEGGAGSRSVYLPEGEWINYWTGDFHSGGQTITASAPLDVLPLFVKNGSIIPMQKAMNYSDEFPLDTLILDTYPSDFSVFTLYEDDGKTNDYQADSYALTEFTCEAQPQGIDVQIGRSQGEYDGKPNSRVYILQLHNCISQPDSVLKNEIRLTQYYSDTQFDIAAEGWWYSGSGNLTLVKCQTIPDLSYTLRLFGKNLISGVDQVQTRLTSFKLYPNYPNPFNAQTIIQYELERSVDVKLEIFNLMGQKVRTLIGREQDAGPHLVIWNGLTDDGQYAASGVYLYRLQAGHFVQTRKLLLFR